MNRKNDSSTSETLPPQSVYDQWAEEYDDADPTTLLDEHAGGVGLVDPGIGARLPFLPEAFDRVISGLVLDHVDDLRSFFLQVAASLRPGGRLIMSAIHPDMQRLTGPVVRFTSSGREYRTLGTVHEVRSITEALRQAGLAPECLLEPCVNQELVTRRPAPGAIGSAVPR